MVPPRLALALSSGSSNANLVPGPLIASALRYADADETLYEGVSLCPRI